MFVGSMGLMGRCMWHQALILTTWNNKKKTHIYWTKILYIAQAKKTVNNCGKDMKSLNPCISDITISDTLFWHLLLNDTAWMIKNILLPGYMYFLVHRCTETEKNDIYFACDILFVHSRKIVNTHMSRPPRMCPVKCRSHTFAVRWLGHGILYGLSDEKRIMTEP